MIMSTVLLVLVRFCPEGLSLGQGLELGVTCREPAVLMSEGGKTSQVRTNNSRASLRLQEALKSETGEPVQEEQGTGVLLLSPTDGYVTQACFNPQDQRSLPLPICSTKSCISASCRLCWSLWVGWWVGAFLQCRFPPSSLDLLDQNLQEWGLEMCTLHMCLQVNSDSHLWELGTLRAKHLRPHFCEPLTGLFSALTQSWLLELVSIPGCCLGALSGAYRLVFLYDTTPNVDSTKCSKGERSSIYKTASRAKERAEWRPEEQRFESMGVPLREGDLLCRGRNEHECCLQHPRYMGAWGPRVACHLKGPFPGAQSPFCEYKVLEVRAQIENSWKLLVWWLQKLF